MGLWQRVRRLMRREIPLHKLAGCGLLALLALVLAGYVLLYPQEAVRRNVDAVDWLPPTASDISYYERTGFGWVRCAEFSIVRDDLLAYATANGWQLEPVTNIAAPICPALLVPFTQTDNPLSAGTISNGLRYKNRHPNGGGITIVYDPATSRCYYSASHR